MNGLQFCKNYNVSIYALNKLIKRNILEREIDYTIKYNLHQRKIKVLRPDIVYKIILDNSNIIRKRHGIS